MSSPAAMEKGFTISPQFIPYSLDDFGHQMIILLASKAGLGAIPYVSPYLWPIGCFKEFDREGVEEVERVGSSIPSSSWVSRCP